ncbi:RTA1 like protein-domain-containing protein [Mycena polygramma]|nr:RTA1 like protein-domain-containing protein [Mycena polygramma]
MKSVPDTHKSSQIKAFLSTSPTTFEIPSSIRFYFNPSQIWFKSNAWAKRELQLLVLPLFPAAVLFSVLFGLNTIAHLFQAIHYRKKFCWVIVMACMWETGGFILRVFSVLNTTSTAFGTPSQLLILLAPLWINAFLYVLMSRLVYFFVPEKHVLGISARRLSLCFVLLDITAFLAQAGGGGMISSTDPKTALLGIHIYMGGIGLQQFFVLIFTGLRPLYVMYTSLGLITVLFLRLDSPITMHEAPFYCLEALPMFVALLFWNLFHPGQVLVGPDSEFPKKEKKS